MIFVVVGGVFIYREVTVATFPFGSVRILGHLCCSAVNGARVRFPPRDSSCLWTQWAEVTIVPAQLALRRHTGDVTCVWL